MRLASGHCIGLVGERRKQSASLLSLSWSLPGNRLP